MNPLGLLRGAVVALVVYGVALVVALLPSRAFDPLESPDALDAAVAVAYLVAAAVGAYAGAWQARAGGVRAPVAGLLAAVVPIVVVGTALVAGEGTENVPAVAFYLANPVGALAGAALYARRWLAATR